MTKTSVILIAVLFALMLCPVIVSAETLTGTMSGTNYSAYNYNIASGAAGNTVRDRIYINDIESIGNPLGFVHIGNGATTSYTAGWPSYASLPMVLQTGGVNISSGRIGFQRSFNLAGVETGGYSWMEFETWNSTGMSGDKIVSIIFTNGSVDSGIWGGRRSNFKSTLGTAAVPVGGMLFYGDSGGVSVDGQTGDQVSVIRTVPFSADYTATKPGGLGISGTVNKNGFSSRVYIINATSGAVVSSEASTNTINYLINTPAASIKICILDSAGSTWYNSSTLFTVAATPTPTPTLPSGFYRTYFQTIDGASGGTVHYSNIQLKNTITGSWTNYTADFDGTGYIDTEASDPINAYATMAGFASVSRLALPAIHDGLYELVMWPDNTLPAVTDGHVNLIVLVNDYTTGKPISNAQISLRDGIASLSGSTNSAGSKVFTVHNKTVITLTAAMPGYSGASTSITTTDFGPDSVRLELLRIYVTTAPTLTGTATVQETVIPGCEGNENSLSCTSAKDALMMNQVRDAGPALIGFAIVFTLLYMMGWKP
jgi:hypothetical protein